MTWDEFVNNTLHHVQGDWVLTNIECPNCGKEIYRYALITMKQIPPKRKYRCFCCGWEETL